MIKYFLIRRQRRWAQALADRVNALMPDDPRLRCVAAGFYAGCVPVLEYRNLEWVSLTLKIDERCGIGREFQYPVQLTDMEIRGEIAKLLNTAMEMAA